MYAENVVKVLKDVTTPQNIVRKVLRENNMEIVKKFSPVYSEYQFQLGKNNRISMRVTEDEFYQKKEALVKNKWETVQEMHIWDSCKKIEDALVKSISEIADFGSRIIR